LFGASDREGSVGAVVLHNLLDGKFQGTIFPINPNHDEVQEQ
jgi:acetyltransferase